MNKKTLIPELNRGLIGRHHTHTKGDNVLSYFRFKSLRAVFSFLEMFLRFIIA